MVTRLNPSCTHVDWWKFSIRLRSLNVCHGWSYEIKSYGAVVTFSDMSFLLNFMKIYDMVKECLVGNTDRQHGDLISFTFLFLGKWARNAGLVLLNSFST
jgi:hypothetical protein